MADPRSSVSSPAASWLWPAALMLVAGAAAASLAAALIGGRDGPATATMTVAVAAAVLAVLLGVVLEVLHRQHESAGLQAAEQRRQQAALHKQEIEELDGAWRAHAERQTASLSSLQQAMEHLVGVRLPAALGGSAVPAASDEPVGPAWVELFERAVTAVEGSAKQRHQDQESLRLLVVTMAQRLQASAHRIQAEAEQMAARHSGDPDVLQVSMGVDHAAAQQGRLAQSLAVLCGEPPGQQWQEPLALVDVVRAASARIVPYERVQVIGELDVAVAASAVEALIHLVAELLANAAQSSPPATDVLATVRTVQRGAVIEIDDGGLGMDEQRLEWARGITSGEKAVGLSDLGENPQTGFAVIGNYVHRYGFRTDVSESPYGGVRAIVLVPTELMEIVEPAGSIPAHAPPPRAGAEVPAAVRASSDVPPPAAEVPLEASDAARDAGLPHRRSRRGSAGAPSPAAQAMPAPEPPDTPEQAGSWMAAFLNAAERPAGDVSAAADHDEKKG
jgi:signal transduction histidine kinase